MSCEEQPFIRAMGVPNLRLLQKRVHNAISRSTSVFTGSKKHEEETQDTFRCVPTARGSFIKLNQDGSNPNSSPASPRVSTTTAPGVNTKLVKDSPFYGVGSERLPVISSQWQNGEVALSANVQQNDNSSQQSTMMPDNEAPKTQQARNEKRNSACSSTDGESKREHQPSFSERWRKLRPHHPKKCTSTPCLTNEGSSGGHWIYTAMSGKVGPLPMKYPSQLLQYSVMPVLSEDQLIKGPLSEKEWLFYKNFSGNWSYNRTKSDSIEEFADLLQLDMPQNPASSGRDSLRLQIDKKHIRVCLDIRGLGTVDETRSWTGSQVPNDRRDMRQGGASCWVERYPQGLILKTSWRNPHGAEMREYLELTSDFMHLITRQDVNSENGRKCQRRIIWDRRLA